MVDLLDNSLQLLQGHVTIKTVLVTYLFPLDKPNNNKTTSNIKVILSIQQQKLSMEKLIINYFIFQFNFVKDLSKYLSIDQMPTVCNGKHEHDQTQWREFFALLEPLKSQCLAAGRRLVSVMGEIRASDIQGIPSKRQLYAQHRALSRALMDPDLQHLRRKGQPQLLRLKEMSKCISDNNRNEAINSQQTQQQQLVPTSDPSSCNTNNRSGTISSNNNCCSDITIRLCEVISIFDEVDRAARRLEQLTEQRRERLRELTRQRALEDEINEVRSCNYSHFHNIYHDVMAKTNRYLPRCL